MQFFFKFSWIFYRKINIVISTVKTGTLNVYTQIQCLTGATVNMYDEKNTFYIGLSPALQLQCGRTLERRIH
jgi:hypothetical protein